MSLTISPKKNACYASFGFATLATLLAVLCTPFRDKVYCLYLVPVLFINHRRGKSAIPLLNFSWALTARYSHSRYNHRYTAAGRGLRIFAGIYPFQFSALLVFVCCTWRGLINAANVVESWWHFRRH